MKREAINNKKRLFSIFIGLVKNRYNYISFTQKFRSFKKSDSSEAGLY